MSDRYLYDTDYAKKIARTVAIQVQALKDEFKGCSDEDLLQCATRIVACSLIEDSLDSLGPIKTFQD